MSLRGPVPPALAPTKWRAGFVVVRSLDLFNLDARRATEPCAPRATLRPWRSSTSCRTRSGAAGRRSSWSTATRSTGRCGARSSTRWAATFGRSPPDLRGYGESRPVGTVRTMAELAGDVWALLDRLGIDRAHVVGLSVGGLVGCSRASSVPASRHPRHGGFSG
jgi:hypothetical protein